MARGWNGARSEAERYVPWELAPGWAAQQKCVLLWLVGGKREPHFLVPAVDEAAHFASLLIILTLVSGGAGGVAA